MHFFGSSWNELSNKLSVIYCKQLLKRQNVLRIFFPPAKYTDLSYQMSVAVLKVIQRSIKSLSQICTQ